MRRIIRQMMSVTGGRWPMAAIITPSYLMDGQFDAREISSPNIAAKSVQANSPAEGYLKWPEQKGCSINLRNRKFMVTIHKLLNLMVKLSARQLFWFPTENGPPIGTHVVRSACDRLVIHHNTRMSNWMADKKENFCAELTKGNANYDFV